MKNLLIATTNPGKIREAAAVLGDLPLVLRSLGEFPPVPSPEESANSFAGNAEIKALYYAKQFGLMALADDSGLEVDGLDGQPGVQSARYAGSAASTERNNEKLIEELVARSVDANSNGRVARFRCALAVATGNTIIATAVGLIQGRIIDQPRGENGFGYDPYFLIPHLNMTMAELTLEGKNKLSHRGTALRIIQPQLAEILRLRSDSGFA